MGAPVLTMPRAYDASGPLGGGSQRRTGARRHGAHALLDEGPRGFDGIEVMRVRRQEADGGARLFDQRADASRLVRGQIVEHDDVAAAQAGHQSAVHPLDKPRRRHRAPRRAQRQPAIDAHRADQCQVVAPVPRPRLDQFTAPRHPRMRAAHRQIRARFIEKNQAAPVDAAQPVAEGAPRRLDYWTVLLRGPRAFFLKTYPVRCNARSTLDRWTRASGAARWLYARVSSSVVRSGFSVSSACSTWRSTGEYQPPPRGAGSTVWRSRWRWTHRTSVLIWIENRVATSAYVSALPWYARTARSRSAVGYGFGMRVIDHSLITNSSEFRD